MLLACLLNPYGMSGVLLPLEIFPKIADAGNPYKSYILEFMSLRSIQTGEGATVSRRSFFVRDEAFLLLALPTSFLVPAVWSTWRSAPPGQTHGRLGATSPPAWLGALGLAFGLTLVGVMGIALPETPAWQVAVGRWMPGSLVALGLVAAVLLCRRSPLAALLAASGGLAVAGALLRLQAYLVGPEESAGWSPRDVGAMLAGLCAVVLTLRAGGRVFRMLLAAIFSYLAVQAYRNANLFGLAAGFVIASNLGEWTAAVLAEHPVVPADERRGQLIRATMSALTVVGIIVRMTGAIAGAFGDVYRLSLSEDPLQFAHQACAVRGAARHARAVLVFDLGQSSVYLFHNGPDRKVFMDPRLEVPSRATFESYVRLEKAINVAAPRWATAVSAMGEPLVLLGHAKNTAATATLMAHPTWRCVYFDAVASVFLPAGRTD